MKKSKREMSVDNQVCAVLDAICRDEPWKGTKSEDIKKDMKIQNNKCIFYLVPDDEIQLSMQAFSKLRKIFAESSFRFIGSEGKLLNTDGFLITGGYWLGTDCGDGHQQVVLEISPTFIESFAREWKMYRSFSVGIAGED